jgi:hypothetical protein
MLNIQIIDPNTDMYWQIFATSVELRRGCLSLNFCSFGPRWNTCVSCLLQVLQTFCPLPATPGRCIGLLRRKRQQLKFRQLRVETWVYWHRMSDYSSDALVPPYRLAPQAVAQMTRPWSGLPLPDIEPRFLGCKARSVFTILTELYRLLNTEEVC